MARLTENTRDRHIIPEVFRALTIVPITRRDAQLSSRTAGRFSFASNGSWTDNLVSKGAADGVLATGYLRLPSSCAGLPSCPPHPLRRELPCFIRPLTIHPHSFLGDRLLCIACICPASSVTGPTVWKLRESARSDSARLDRLTIVQKGPGRRRSTKKAISNGQAN